MKKNIFEKKLFIISDKLQNKRIFQAIRHGLIMAIPLTILGAFSLMLRCLPIEAYQNFICKFCNGRICSFLDSINNSTLGIISATVVFTITYSYSNSLSNNKSNTIAMPVVAVAGYMSLLGINDKGFSISYFGGSGMFTAIISAVLVCLIYKALNNSKLYNISFNKSGMDTVLVGAIKGIFPAIIVVSSFTLLRYIFVKFFNENNIQDLFSSIATSLFSNMGANIFTAILFIFCIQIMWFLGIHGNNVLEDVNTRIFNKSLDINQQLVASGKEPTEIFSKTFFDIFVLIGGSGAIICLIIAGIVFVNKKRVKSIINIGFLPSIFNISEIITFGLPIVFNPILFIPFIMVPIVCTVIAYFATYIGFVPVICNSVEWTTPIIISGYKATGSINGSFLQIILIVVGVLIYKPFMRIYAENREIYLNRQLQKLTNEMKILEMKRESSSFLDRTDDIGGVARMLAEDLHDDISNNKLFVVYQPSINNEGKIIGAEALIRWKHDIGDYIYPPLIIAIAKEDGFLNVLEKYILDTVCSDMRFLEQNFDNPIKVSINITASSLANETFQDLVDETIEKNGNNRSNILFEIDEHEAVMVNDDAMQKLMALKEKGHNLIVDNFGMGHTSMMYLQSNVFDFAKLHGSLLEDILINERKSEVVLSIIKMSEILKFNVIAKYVETSEQENKLKELGCCQYQGYLYSRPVKFSRLLEVLSEKEPQMYE